MKNHKEIKITKDDLKAILGRDFAMFQKKIIPNCFCLKCADKKGTATIVNYDIVLNDLNDMVLLGFCKSCNSRVNRYVETGEVNKYSSRIAKIKKKHGK